MKLPAKVFILSAIALLVAMAPVYAADLSDEDVDNLVRRSYQYVAMYNVNNKSALKLDENSGIEIHVAAEKPEGVPEESWLPINRKDEGMDIVLRAYVADLEKMKTWQAPKAEKLPQ